MAASVAGPTGDIAVRARRSPDYPQRPGTRRTPSDWWLKRAPRPSTGTGATNPRSSPATETLKTALRKDGRRVESFNGALLFEPWAVRTRQNESYRVFTPFWRLAWHARSRNRPGPRRAKSPVLSAGRPRSALDELGLEPSVDWAGGLRSNWRPGEAGAVERIVSVPGGPGGLPYEEGPTRTWSGPRGCRRISISARSALGKSGGRAAAPGGRLPAAGAVLLAGARLARVCPSSALSLPAHARRSRSGSEFADFPWARRPTDYARWQHGRPAIPSSTPACASCGRPAGCTTACG